jgi:rhamnosyltransferase
MRVSIVIRCYNEERHIGRLLAGIMEQTLRDVEIIVVDSGSTDATVAIASRYPVRIVTIPKEEFSFGRSLNLGCAAATGDIIVIASAHVYPVYRDWLEQLIAPFDDPQTALVYGKQRGDENTKYSEHQVFARWFPDKGTLKQTHPFCNNANAAIRRSLWQQFPYDESLTGLEDLDWAARVQAQGYTLAYIPAAEIVHVHEETWTQVYNRYRREAMAFKRIFPQADFTFRDFLRLWVGNTVTDWRRAFREGVLRREWRSILLFRWMQFRGTYHGYQERGDLDAHLRRKFYYPNTRFSTPSASSRDEALKIRYDVP